jgi:hypothetical protein
MGADVDDDAVPGGALGHRAGRLVAGAIAARPEAANEAHWRRDLRGNRAHQAGLGRGIRRDGQGVSALRRQLSAECRGDGEKRQAKEQPKSSSHG